MVYAMGSAAAAGEKTQMLVFWEARLAFLATPKTGSSAVEKALADHAAMAVLRPPHLKHTNVHRYHRFIAPFLKQASGADFTVCALIRDPEDWLGSWFRYRQRPDTLAGNSTSGKSFAEFVAAWCSDPQPAFAALGSQARFLQPRQGAGVDHLFRYEDMDRFTAFLADRLGRPVDLPRVNVSPAGDTHLPDPLRAQLRKAAARDFALHAAADGGPAV
jgi:hypothetical protein